MKSIFRQLVLATLVTSCCGTAFCADWPPGPQGPKVPATQPSIPCPQCGVWAISFANEVAGPHDQNIRDLDGPVGSYLFVDERTLTIPFCGSFQYTVKSSSTESQDAHQTYRYVMALKRDTGDSLLCKAHQWTLDLRISDGAFDAAIQANFKLTTDDGTPARQFHAWNNSKSDPSQSDGTPGITQVAVFKIAEATTALSRTAARVYRWYANEGAKPFDAARFGRKVKAYCENYYYAVPHHANTGTFILECEYKLLAAKYNEFVTFSCDKKTGKQSCRLPTEALRAWR